MNIAWGILSSALVNDYAAASDQSWVTDAVQTASPAIVITFRNRVNKKHQPTAKVYLKYHKKG
ncbi:MAG: hypothetical protein OXF58_05575, partial [Gammaproteobacteria bacterium]|nr:hypothetical protein [Gammaproteobacteria bacterium]